jgi:hypothetical protein
MSAKRTEQEATSIISFRVCCNASAKDRPFEQQSFAITLQMNKNSHLGFEDSDLLRLRASHQRAFASG